MFLYYTTKQAAFSTSQPTLRSHMNSKQKLNLPQNTLFPSEYYFKHRIFSQLVFFLYFSSHYILIIKKSFISDFKCCDVYYETGILHVTNISLEKFHELMLNHPRQFSFFLFEFSSKNQISVGNAIQFNLQLFLF